MFWRKMPFLFTCRWKQQRYTGGKPSNMNQPEVALWIKRFWTMTVAAWCGTTLRLRVPSWTHCFLSKGHPGIWIPHTRRMWGIVPASADSVRWRSGLLMPYLRLVISGSEKQPCSNEIRWSSTWNGSMISSPAQITQWLKRVLSCFVCFFYSVLLCFLLSDYTTIHLEIIWLLWFLNIAYFYISNLALCCLCTAALEDSGQETTGPVCAFVVS